MEDKYKIVNDKDEEKEDAKVQKGDEEYQQRKDSSWQFEVTSGKIDKRAKWQEAIYDGFVRSTIDAIKRSYMDKEYFLWDVGIQREINSGRVSDAQYSISELGLDPEDFDWGKGPKPMGDASDVRNLPSMPKGKISAEVDKLLEQRSTADEEDKDIIDRHIKELKAAKLLHNNYTAAPEETMTWNLDTAKNAAIDTLRKLATKLEDPMIDDAKAVEDRAAQDATIVVDNLANERSLAEQYNRSDISKGLDKESEFYKIIQQHAVENFKKSEEHILPLINKYTDERDRKSMVGSYFKAFEDKFYEEVKKSWEELRPSQTVNTEPMPTTLDVPAEDVVE